MLKDITRVPRPGAEMCETGFKKQKLFSPPAAFYKRYYVGGTMPGTPLRRRDRRSESCCKRERGGGFIEERSGSKQHRGGEGRVDSWEYDAG